ncbi:MAG: DMT family transporter [Candidatus Puniceispirillaceae bacterium]
MTQSVKDKIAWAFVLICPAFFASNMLLARGMSGVFPPMAMALGRWFFVGLLICALLGFMRRLAVAQIKKEWRGILGLAALGMGLCGGPVYLAGDYTTAMNIGLIYSAAPLLIALLAFVRFGERLNKRQMFGLAMGLCGVVIIITQADISRLLSLSLNQGDMLIVMATMSFAIYSLGLKYSATSLTQIQRFGAMALGGALWHAPFVIAEVMIRGPLPEITLVIIGALCILVFVASLGAYLSYGFIVSQLGTTIAGATLYLSPIYAAGLAMLLLGEELALFHIIGGGLILPGLWLVSQRSRKSSS